MRFFRKEEPSISEADVLAAELNAWEPLRDGDRIDSSAGDVYARLHRARPAALCISGGGIRSATFGLGVLQGLARKGLLQHVDYISTVSGGGYIGSWLTSWLTRESKKSNEREAAKSVFSKLAEGDDAHPYSSPTKCEQDEIAHLRSYSNYLTPRLGLLSADTWTLAATYLRNVIVNWFVLIPFLLACLAVPRIWVAALASANRVRGEVATTHLMTTLLAVAGIAGLLLVIYLAFVRPVPNQEFTTKRGKPPYGILFAIFGPGMLIAQALAMCMVRAIEDHGSGTDSSWWLATWDVARKILPFGARIVPLVKQKVDALGADTPLLLSLCAAILAMNHLGWVIYTVRLRRASKEKPWRERAAFELIGATIAGASTGFFLWIIILRLFGEPMRNIQLLPSTLADLRVEMFVCFAPALYLLAFFVQTMMFVGITGRFNDDEDREWWARWAGWLLILSVSSVAIASIAVYGPLLIALIPKTFAALGGISGVVTLALGRSGTSPATQAQKADRDLKATLTNVALAAAAPVFIVVIFSTLSYVNSWVVHNLFGVPGDEGAPAGALARLAVFHFAVLRHTELFEIVAYAVALFAIAWIASKFVQVNRFSMHGLYRNRLTRAYLGASNTDRHPNPFTGFDDKDNVAVCDLPRRPFHVINTALNLVGGDNLAWQERKAASFTISPLHCGSQVAGYCESAKYASAGSGTGITLGTAVAISGAAVSPNMGYHTSTTLSLLLTLFNVRLGWWLGNPGRREHTAAGPDSSLVTILAEALGRTKSDSRWIYLSDGGHFDNLGLYEMVRRRCHYIVVSDAGRDPKITFEDLGNAIRKIRIDLGVPITTDDVKIYPRDEKKAGRYYVTGTIHYKVVDGPDAPDGVLIYIKPAIYGREPIDVRNYAAQNVQFPHESTSDQWFTESQFESYRALGAFVVDEICRMQTFKSIGDFADRLEQRHKPAGPQLSIRRKPETDPASPPRGPIGPEPAV